MDKNDKLKAFAQELKTGYQLVREKKNEEAIEKLKPFVELMRKSGASHIRLFVSYSLAQLRSGDFEGFLVTYEEIQEMKTKSDEDERMKQQMEGLFNEVMGELQK